MNRVAAVYVLFSVSVSSCLAKAEGYRINLLSEGEEIAVIELTTGSDAAVAKVGNVTEHFDLKKQRWQHDESKQWVTLSQCKAWAKQSKTKSSMSIASAPEQIRPFIQWSLAPNFEITSSEGRLSLISGQVDYEIAVEESSGDLANYYRYARLNAYKKAMTDRKLPPFAELLVLDELERRNLMPISMEIKIPGVTGAPTLKMVITTLNE